MHAELAFDHGLRVGRKRVARLMRGAGLEGVHRRRTFKTTRRDRDAAPAPDLVQRQFAPAGPDRLWVADITYVPTWSGFLFLAVVVDAWSRAVVGWAMAGHLGSYLADPSSLRLAVIFFFISTLIFVFGIPFFAGLRELTRTADASGLASGAVTVGAALFFAGGLISEVMSTGMATVVQAAPSYTLDANAALATQSLQFAALLQGQVGLGVVMIAVSLAARSGAFAPRGLLALGVVAGVINILRPLAVTTPPLALVLFLPTFVWIALASLALIRFRRPTE